MSQSKFAIANGIRLAYEELGSATDPVVVLIPGMATQLIAWPMALCESIANSGFRVIRLDNRDAGLSQKFSNVPTPNPLIYLYKKQLMISPTPPYTLQDMANDVIGLLDYLSIYKAHYVGASMGGMIAQEVAGRYPHRTLSLTSIMSSSGAPWLRGPRLPALLHLLRSRPTDRAGLIDRGIKSLQIANNGSPHLQSTEQLRERVLAGLVRSHYPEGALRHMIAISASGYRRNVLRRIKAPSLVVHGSRDPIIPMAAGRSTARLISGSKLIVRKDMGHDIPPNLGRELAPLLTDHFQVEI